MIKLDTPTGAGYLAARNGLSRWSNPYNNIPSSYEWFEWDYGWTRGSDQSGML